MKDVISAMKHIHHQLYVEKIIIAIIFFINHVLIYGIAKRVYVQNVIRL